MKRSAMTLLELLVVVAIIALLAGLLLGAVQKVRSAAARADCQNRMKQLALAAANHHDTQRHFPTGRVPLRTPAVAGEWTGSGWPTQLLPNLEQSAVWSAVGPAFAQTIDITQNPPHVGMATVVKAFVCPADARIAQPVRPKIYPFQVACTSYLGVAGTRARRQDGVFFNDSRTRIADIPDGTSNTLLFGERPPDPGFALGWWYAGYGLDAHGTFEFLMGVAEPDPTNVLQPPCGKPDMAFGPASGFDDRCAPFHYWSPHGGGANFAFADGSVRFVSYAAAPVMPALSTRAGGEVAELP
jgi:prepilin-type processing-associated H-X9-DG protein/prepilin-type N-terminal cleavage/methylation domain-containing protein